MNQSISFRRIARASLFSVLCIQASFGQAPVTVKNDVRESIPIRDLSAQNAVAFTGIIKFTAPAQQGELAPAGYQVPARKRLVIEHVSFRLALPAHQAVYLKLFTKLNKVEYEHRFGHTNRLPDGISFELLSGNEMVKIYADAGTVVNGGMFITSATSIHGYAYGVFTFEGYLVDMPLVLETSL